MVTILIVYHSQTGRTKKMATAVAKGSSSIPNVRTVLKETGGDGLAAYLGDDLTDEDAFGAIKGKGMGVLVRTELRATAADLWIRPPDELLRFLELWLPEHRPKSEVSAEMPWM